MTTSILSVKSMIKFIDGNAQLYLEIEVKLFKVIKQALHTR